AAERRAGAPVPAAARDRGRGARADRRGPQGLLVQGEGSVRGLSGRWLELRAQRAVPRADPDGAEDAELADALLADALVQLGGRAVEERDGWLITHVPEPD